MAILADGLLPASFRGVPFAVEADDTGGGRRIALHTYPGRDEPWAEDMGRAPRTFRFRGFIVDGDVVFQGGPIQLQRALLLAALEREGSGALIHPTLGVLSVSVRSFGLGADLGAGRKSSVDVEFVESGKRTFPSLLSSGSGLLGAATLCQVALAADLVRAVDATSSVGQAAGASAAASDLGSQVTAAAGDATALTRVAALLPGNNGRYAAGANAGFTGSNSSSYAGASDLAVLIADASAQRAAVESAAVEIAAAIAAVGSTTTYMDVGAAIAALVDALLAACADPADAVRLLTDLLGYQPPTIVAGSGAAVLVAFRRAIATALAKACAVYQPHSYDDAFATMASVAAALDAQATVAADAGDDASFKALRSLRVQVVQDLRARGATLARVRLFAVSQPVPALTLAQRFYRDPTRADELVDEAAPRHPLFMPTSFTALAA